MDVENAVILFSLVSGVTGIAYGVYLGFWVLRQEAGNETMQKIALAIQEGASAYLKRQYRTVGMVAIVMFFILLLVFDLLTAMGFLVGAVASATAGFVGMVIAVRANVRTAHAASSGLKPALNVAFRGGAVTGL